MISLTKGAKPQILKENDQAWTEALLTKLALGEDLSQAQKSRYRSPEIKDALKVETFGKCAYCESKFEHIAFGHVEHITPKSLKPELSFLWENLTIACEICNNKKAVSEDVIDPYITDPSNHLHFEGVVVASWPGDDQGYNTIQILDLNRAALLGERKRRRDEIYTLFEVLAATTSPLRKAALRELLEGDDAAREREYTAMARELVRKYLSHYDRHMQSKQT